ncbi:MAG: lytic transglycosylase domain-containing protein [Rickettsiaceae bacterium]|nr:lytic transglycosylase domain-containing protein [Rickettsiaceae bacterium]
MNKIVSFLLLLLNIYSFTSYADIKKIAAEFDAGRLEAALNLADARKYHQIRDLIKSQIYLNPKNKISFEELSRFIETRSHILEKNALIEILEQKINDRTSKEHIIKWFKRYNPRTPNGHLYYYRAAVTHIKNQNVLQKIIRNAWINVHLDKSQSFAFYSKYKALLSIDDTSDKISNLIYSGKINEAKNYLHLLDKNYKQVFNAMIAILENKPNAEKEFHNVRGSYKYYPGLLYAYLKLHLKSGTNDELTALHLKAPRDFDSRAKEWWYIKNYYTRELIADKKYHAAYKIASSHYNSDPVHYTEAEWLSGWISLRFLKKPEQAIAHFRNVYNKSRKTITKARAAYWLGRAYMDQKNKELGLAWFNCASKLGYSYYGMLAQKELGFKKLILPVKPEVTKEDRVALSKNKYAQIAEFLSLTSKDNLFKLYITEAIHTLDTKGAKVLLYSRIDKKNVSKRLELAKILQESGVLILCDSFPVPYKLPKNADAILSYAIIRQESMFDPSSKSVANAVGVMQMVPSTCEALAAKLGTKCNVSKLKNADYSIKLGTFHLSELMKQTNSYIKTLALYNAGPVAKTWDQIFGDPASMSFREIIDRVEMIPFAETRNYTQRVIENMQIYRYVLFKKDDLYISNLLIPNLQN